MWNRVGSSIEARMEYTIESSRYDLKRLCMEFETYAEMMVEYEIMKRDIGDTGMAEAKMTSQRAKIQNYYNRLDRYLETRAEITEAQRLLYGKDKSDDGR